MVRRGSTFQQGLVAFAAVLATSAACSQSAFGWTASATAGTLAAQAAPGEANLFAVSDGDPGTFVVTDDGAAFVGPAPAGCSALDDGEGHLFGVRCDAAALPRVTIDAADGADVIDALAVTVVVTAAGGDGNDTLTGGDRAERLDGGAGDDAVDGGAGGDTVLGGAGADEVFGSGGDDAVDGGGENDRLDGGDGADRANGADGDDVVDGGAGDDTLRGDAGNDQLGGDDGNDTMEGGAGDDSFDGGLADDDAAGGAGNDVLDGTEGRDDLDGGPGDDALTAGPAGTALRGGDGNDQLQGAEGGDTLLGQAGADVLRGDEGADGLDGGDGDDTLDGGPGPDTLSGGLGGDRITYEFSAANVSVSLDELANDGEAGEADAVASDVEALQGGLGDDRLVAGRGPVVLLGGDGSDTLIGGPAADTLDGGADGDRLDGGAGPDRITGGAGGDTVTYEARRRAVTVKLGDDRAQDGERGEGDLVARDVETVLGGRGDDRLAGADGVANVLAGGAGNDRFQVRANRDAAADRTLCGTGTDRAHGDDRDRLGAPDCENVWVDGARRRYGTSPPGRPSLYLVARPLRVSGGGVRLRLRCQKRTPRRCRAAIRLQKRGEVVARTHAALLPGVTRAVTVPVTAAGARRLARYRSGTLVRILISVRGRGGRGVPLVASLPLLRTR